MQIKKAERKRVKLRIALDGPSGSGKTLSSLKIARGLVGPTGKIGVIDTERDSASLYAGDEDVGDFDVITLETFGPDTFVKAIGEFSRLKYDAVIIDSLSHAWMGKDGALERVDAASARGGNSFTAWRNVTPQHNALVDAMLQCPAHLIATMRVKTEYVLEMNAKGKLEPVKKGMATVQREGMEYEFTVVGDINIEHVMTTSKTRCSALDGKAFRNPGQDVARVLLDWLNSAPASETAPPAPTAAPAATPTEAAPDADAVMAVVEQMQAAQTPEALDAVASGIAAKWPDGASPERVALRKAYQVRRAELRTAGAA